uniref:STN domain-containing protein n=1 Tax=Hafnia paralvei TaxID=546367 RepID=UPI0038CF2C96
MRLLILFLALGLLEANASGYSQTVTLSERNARLEQIFKKIERQTHFFFWYENKTLNDTRKVNIDLQNASLEHALEQCFANQPLSYVIIDKTIVVKEKKQVTVVEPTTVVTATPAPEPPVIKIRGTVSSAEGQPLAGAAVKLKGSNKGIAASNDGSFLLEIPEQGGILVISYVGYQT